MWTRSLTSRLKLVSIIHIKLGRSSEKACASVLGRFSVFVMIYYLTASAGTKMVQQEQCEAILSGARAVAQADLYVVLP